MEGGVQRLRPLNFGEILDVAINVVAKNAKTLLLTVAVVVVPVQIVSILIQLSTAPESFGGTSFTGLDAAFFGGLAVATILGFLASTVATGASFKAISDAYLGERPDWRESLRFAFRRFGPLLWLAVLSALLLTLATLALIIPAIYLYIAWVVSVPALLLEDVRGRRALGRSFRLVRGRWWESFGIILIGLLIVAAVNFIVGVVVGVVSVVAPENVVANIVVGGLLGIVAAVVSTPVTAAFVSVLYFDLRVRKEGFDLELLAERIGAPADPARRPPAYVSRENAGPDQWQPPPPPPGPPRSPE